MKIKRNSSIPCDKCTGCSACAQSCPASCISMQADTEGFLYPVVDTSACLHCYLCERVCPVQQKSAEKYDVIKDTSAAWALIASDADLHGRVGSGGAFSLMARHILEDGGAVVGAAWTSDWLVEHVVVYSWEDYVRLCGTKYLQSNPGTTLKQTRELLNAGRRVLFCGTGCQIAGLVRFLRKDYPNLITVNIACYGAPSPGVWLNYLSGLQKEYQLGEIRDVQFRKKEDGSSLNMLVEGTRSSYKKYVYGDPYGWGLVNDVINRPSCENCLFKGAASLSDITVGDAWGIEEYDPNANAHEGISVVVSHTLKGAALVAELEDECRYYRSLPLPGAIAQNMGVICATNSHPCLRQRFFSRFVRGKSALRVLSRLQRGSLWSRGMKYARRLWGLLKKILRRLLCR